MAARPAENRATFRVRTETESASDRYKARNISRVSCLTTNGSCRDDYRRKAAQDLDADPRGLCPIGRARSHQPPDGAFDDRLPQAGAEYRAGIGTEPQRF